ncbi:hypothetical protein [Mucilaginibacter sp.]
MPNIKLHYLYRDGANYKQFGVVVFDNPQHLTPVYLTSLIQSKLIDGTWFYANQWQLPDLHFGTWDDEIDHTLHEFEMVEYTSEPPNTMLTLARFIQRIENTNRV